MIEQKLEIAIITYNRAAALRHTIGQLAAGPFRGCKLRILDNCSTDETPRVCEEAAALLPDVIIVRHPRNLGASPNYLRAVELSTATYTWVMGDDDNLDLSDCQDVIDAIETGRFDLISLGSMAQRPEERGATATVRELVERGTRYFSSFTFITGVIFRTELFDSRCISEGYRNAANLYPHFPFVVKAVEENFATYASKHWLVTRQNVEHNHLSYLRWLRHWVLSCAVIEDKQLRKKAIYDFSEITLHPQVLVFAIARDGVWGRQMSWKDIFQMFFVFVGEQKLIWLLHWPLLAVPTRVYQRVREWHWKRKARLTGEAPPDRTHYDPLRL